jgi:hypothetical protein
LILISHSSWSQNTGSDNLKIHEKSFSEELYMTTDRDFYVAGEKVWLKIFKLNALTSAPVNLSKVVYVDLLDPENNPVDQLKIEVKGFSGSGVIVLPDTLRTGNYILRSYTNWMQNFPKDLFAYKSISVINPFDKITTFKIPSVQIPDSVIFYPEGGHLQAGFETRLGFKIIDRNGNPVRMSGSLVDDNNDTLCHLKTGYNGYGFVSVKPSDQRGIFLVASDKNQEWKIPLPHVFKDGFILTAGSHGEDSQTIAKLNSGNYPTIKGDSAFLRVYSTGLSGFSKTLIPATDHEFNISAKDIPYGISHLQVVDGHGNILTDRWISKENDKLINYKIDLEKNKYAPRENIKINISATDNSGNPVESDFSISIVKSVTVNREKLSFEHFRQLPGEAPVIEDCKLKNINDYLVFFRPPEHLSAPDENADFPAHLPELEGHLITGHIKDRVTGEPLQNEFITLSLVGKAAVCLFAKTDDSGSFSFVTKENGLKEIVIQPLYQRKDCYVDLKNPFPSGLGNHDNGLFFLDASKLDNINNVIISMQINNIYEPFYYNPFNSAVPAHGQNFYSKPDKTIMMSDYIELTSVKEIVSELIPGVTTTKNNGKINFRFSKPYPAEPFKNSPLVLVDGVPVYDLEKVIAINSKDIEKVDVLNDRYYISGLVIDGIIHFITKKGNLTAYDLDKSVFRMEYDLLKRKNDFYSPDYSVDSLKNNHLPDFRNTLYWNPDMHTDKTGRATAGFYSSDESYEYTIIIEGITLDGMRGSATLPLIIQGR